MHIHLIGVAGTAMATLAAMLQRRGHRVTGSDAGVYPPMSDFLRAERIEVFEGYDAAHVDADADMVVVGNAISRGNVELETVLERRQRYCSLPERIRDEFLWDRDPIVVSGTHGKTTTTSMVAWVLTHAGLDPSLLVGGIAGNFDASYRLGAGRDFVIEGDEYDSAFFDKTAKFLKYVPHTVIVNNVEFDHADIYPDVSGDPDRVHAPPAGWCPPPAACSSAQTTRARPRWSASAFGIVETFGLSDGAHWQARDLAAGPDGTSFTVTAGRRGLGQARVPMTGLHNVRNALAAIAVAASRGVAFDVDRGGAGQVCWRQAAHGTARRRRRRLGLRRLRAPPDRDCGDAAGRATGAPRRARVGDLRAAIGVELPARVPGGIHRCVR